MVFHKSNVPCPLLAQILVLYCVAVSFYPVSLAEAEIPSPVTAVEVPGELSVPSATVEVPGDLPADAFSSSDLSAEKFPPPPAIPRGGKGRYFVIAFDGEVIGTSMTVPAGPGTTESRTSIDLSRIDGSTAMEFHAREERDEKGRIKAYSSKSTTTAGILETSFTVRGDSLVGRAKLPRGTEKASAQKILEHDFHVLDNNIYGQIASIVEKWAPECNPVRRVMVYIPSFMKFKDLQLEKVGDSTFSLSIGSQFILAGMQGATLESLDFPFQMFTASSCGAGRFASASLVLAALGDADLADPSTPGPESFTLTATLSGEGATSLDLVSTPWYSHMGKASGNTVSGTWTRTVKGKCSGNGRWAQGFPAKALEEVSIRMVRASALAGSRERPGLTPLSVKVSKETQKILGEAGISTRWAFGLAIAGAGASSTSLVPMSWIEARVQQTDGSGGDWTPVDPLLNMHPGRYIRIGLSNGTAAAETFRPSEDAIAHFSGGGLGFPERPESGRFILRLEGSDTVGVAAYDMRKSIDFSKGFKTNSAIASTFFAFGNLEARKTRGGVDSYNYTFVARTSTEFDPARGFRSLTASSKSSRGDGSHTLARVDNGLEAVTRSGGKQVFTAIKKGEWAVLEPWNLSHWRKIFCDTVGANSTAPHHRVRAMNPFSTGKGLTVLVDLFVHRREGVLTVKAPVYGMTFDLDPDSLRILGFSDAKTRIIGIPVDESTFMGTAAELGTKARFDVVGFGFR